MVCDCEECKYTLFYKYNVHKHKLAEIHSNISIYLGWKIRKHLPLITVLLLRNSTNFAKVNKPEINQNALTPKISTCKKTPKFSK